MLMSTWWHRGPDTPLPAFSHDQVSPHDTFEIPHRGQPLESIHCLLLSDWKLTESSFRHTILWENVSGCKALWLWPPNYFSAQIQFDPCTLCLLVTVQVKLWHSFIHSFSSSFIVNFPVRSPIGKFILVTMAICNSVLISGITFETF